MLSGSTGVKDARVKEVLDEIAATGSYTHTFDELQHGARCAWRCVVHPAALQLDA